MPNDNKRQKTTLLFLMREHEVLLAMKKRRFGEGKWNGVGGKLDAGETTIEAAKRECQEEINVAPITIKHMADLHFFQQPETHPTMNTDCSVYICTEWKGEPSETEEMSPQWFDIDSIPYDDMWPDDKFWLPQVLGGQKVDGTFVFDQNEVFISHEVRVVG